MNSKTVREEMLVKYPSLVARSKTSRPAAIKLMCIECMGGSYSDAKECTTKDCAIWPHSIAARALNKADPNYKPKRAVPEKLLEYIKENKKPA